MPHNKTEKTRGVVIRKRAAERMALIRAENVERHNKYAARSKLRNDQVAAQRVATMQQELDRLREASIHGTGLDAIRIQRMGALKQIIGSYK